MTSPDSWSFVDMSRFLVLSPRIREYELRRAIGPKLDGELEALAVAEALVRGWEGTAADLVETARAIVTTG